MLCGDSCSHLSFLRKMRGRSLQYSQRSHFPRSCQDYLQRLSSSHCLRISFVAKWIVLTFGTDFFNDYLVENSLDDLISILRRVKMEDKLLEFLPPRNPTTENFPEHLTKAGLTALVEYNERKVFEVKLKEIKAVLTSQVREEIKVDEVIETVKQQVKDAKLPEIEVVHVIWVGIMDAVQWSGKNQQQNSNAVLRQVI